MKRHPLAIAREQRAITKARTALHSRSTSEVPDARDDDPPEDPRDREPCRVMRANDTGWTWLVTLPRQLAIIRAARETSRCVVVSQRSGKRLFDNKRVRV